VLFDFEIIFTLRKSEQNSIALRVVRIIFILNKTLGSLCKSWIINLKGSNNYIGLFSIVWKTGVYHYNHLTPYYFLEIDYWLIGAELAAQIFSNYSPVKVWTRNKNSKDHFSHILYWFKCEAGGLNRRNRFVV
jgi:hypothetical protein